jgi:L-seryl-tRNA(Ser) seleniumtransferase
VPGGPRGLQNRRDRVARSGGFDSRTPPLATDPGRPDPRRAVPRTDAVLADPRLREAAGRLGTRAVRDVVAAALQQVRDGDLAPSLAADAAVAALPATASPLGRVINATGVLVHTNLGRAPLSQAAVVALGEAAGNTPVELDPATGRRGRRGQAVLDLLASAVPGAEAVHVVNNNAAALALLAAALAGGREVLLSRGEFVEIGDGFRVYELLAAAGAVVREVGATNRTHLADYTGAVGPDTALILRVHPSNYAQTGFVSWVPVRDLAGVGPPVAYDVGSGLLVPEPGLPDEPDVASALAAGAAVVTASADKLLGGPQAGLMFGRAELIERCRRHPLARAVRVDKLTLAALAATVAGPTPPVLAALRAPYQQVRDRAEQLARGLAGLDAQVTDCYSTVGGGGAPGVELPSAAVSLPSALAGPLRCGDPPVYGRVTGGRCRLDLRSVPPAQDAALAVAVRAAAARAPSSG